MSNWVMRYYSGGQTIADGGSTPPLCDVNGNLKTTLAAAGTAGSPSATVITVQGVTSGTPVIVGGAVASGTADSGNPVKTAAVYQTATTLATVTAGNRVDNQADSVGNLRTITAGNGLAPFATGTLAAYALTRNSNSLTSAQGLALATMGGFWNGTNIIPAPGDSTGGFTKTNPQAGTDRSITATTTSQQLMAANTTRTKFLVKNDTAIVVWVNIGATAVATAGGGNIAIAASGGYLELTGTSGAINIIAASGTPAITAREM